MTRSLALAALTALALAAPASAQQPFEPSPIQHIQVNGANLGYRTVGSGPPLVMIVGFGATMAEWDPALISDLYHQFKPSKNFWPPSTRSCSSTTAAWRRRCRRRCAA